MSYTYKFKANEKYGVDDINGIISNFTSAGVNNYSDLNGMATVLADAGVTEANYSCMVVLAGDYLKILPGVAFFYDGSTIMIGTEGELLDINKYVYFTKDPITNEGCPVSSDTAPGTYDIPLAEYSEGVLTDKRNFAVSKIEGFGTNTYQDVSSEVNGTYVLTEKDPTWNCVKKIPLVRTDFKYIMINVTSKAREITGGFFGIRNGANFLWTGGCFHDYHARAMSNNDCIDTAGDAQKGVLVETGWSKSDYVLIDFDITAGNLQVYLKPPSARTFTLSDVSVILC